MDLAFREKSTAHQRPRRPIKHFLTLFVVGILILATSGIIIGKNLDWEVRAEARTAVQALKDGDLTSLEEVLAENRGQSDFAFFFASKITPRDLGDALGTVAGTNKEHPLRADVDVDTYELTLVDLAGTLSLATHGIGNRALAESWTDDFILASTSPLELYGQRKNLFDKEGKQREKQDIANKTNLLLLLSRGYWSSEFLEAATKSYYAFDLQEGSNAWPSARPSKDVQYAPAPTGVYLTDGILALTAALTANPEAAEWAFTKFIPHDVKIEDTDYSLGGFTHYLLFEHRFPEHSNGESLGITATLTALSSAIESASWTSDIQKIASSEPRLDDPGPKRDAAVLSVLAKELPKQSNCSWHPRDYIHCLSAGVKAVWKWIHRWGHTVLNILTLATFAPPPFNTVGTLAAATNASWYAIAGDYSAAGLSLAATVPRLSFTKIADAGKRIKANSVAAARAVTKGARSAKAASKHQDAAVPRKMPNKETKDEIIKRAPTTPEGDHIDPNTNKVIPKEGPFDIGHVPGHEWKCIAHKAKRMNWSADQLKEWINNPDLYQIEDPSSNRSHKFEAKKCNKVYLSTTERISQWFTEVLHRG
ncbi:MAG: GH-E family nuclease [Ancrocorticia sp.]